MVHTHSQAGRWRRQARAFERGFVTYAPKLHKHLLVPAALVHRLRLMLSSLVLHVKHNDVAG